MHNLVSRLHLSNFYTLDRLELSGWASIDKAAQQRISNLLSRLGDPAYDRSLGLYGRQLLLGGASPSQLAWSVVLYERGADCNYLRIRADSLNQPFDINAGAKLQLEHDPRVSIKKRFSSALGFVIQDSAGVGGQHRMGRPDSQGSARSRVAAVAGGRTCRARRRGSG